MSNGIQISGFGINVHDLDRAADFYTGALGLQEKAKYDLGEMHEVLVGGEHDTSAILLVKHSTRTASRRSRCSATTSAARTSGAWPRAARRCRNRGRSSRWASRWPWSAIPTAT